MHAQNIFEQLLATLRMHLDNIGSHSDASAHISHYHRQGQGGEGKTVDTLRTHPNPELADQQKEYGTVWIAYIRFMRRVGGLPSAHKAFKRATQDHWIPWEVYEAAGVLMLTEGLTQRG